MSEIEEFINEYNALVIGDETTIAWQIVHVGTDDVFRTFSSPVEVEKVNSAIDYIKSELATGRQVLRLQALRQGGSVRAQMSITVEGRSVAARNSGNEQVQHAKALAMNVQTAESQLNNMQARLQASEQATLEAEERARSMTQDVYKMGDLVNRMLMEKETAILDKDEREARMQNMAAIATTLTPILGQAVIIASKYLEYKVGTWEKKWAEDAAKAGSKPSNVETTVVEEKTN